MFSKEVLALYTPFPIRGTHPHSLLIKDRYRKGGKSYRPMVKVRILPLYFGTFCFTPFLKYNTSRCQAERKKAKSIRIEFLIQPPDYCVCLEEPR